MNALLGILDIPEASLKPTLHPAIWVEPKDRSDASEDQRQAEFVATMRKIARGCRVVGIPNAGRRSRWEAAKRKREGMLAGEPDVAVAWATVTARIEFKNGRAMPDEDQIGALNWYHLRGHPIAVCRTAEGAMAWLRSIGAPVPEVRR